MGISDPMFTGDEQRRLTEVERQLRNLTSGRRLEDASIGARGIRLLDGGSMTISGGSLLMNDETGTIGLVYFGDSNEFAGSRTWLFGFPSGEIAFGLLGSTGDGYWGGRDHAGNLILSNDSLSGVGLGKPYLNYRLVPGFDAQSIGEGAKSLWPSTDSTSPVKIMYGINPIQHPRVSIGVSTSTSGGGDVSWRLDVGGQTAATGTNGGSQIVPVPGWGDTIGFGDSVGIDLYAWCTGGATRAWIQCDRLYGLQS